MLNRALLLDALADRVSPDQLKEIKAGVFRAPVMHQSKPYSVHFFDINKPFLQSEFDLDAYQRELLAEEYYAHPGPLQWNYYLDFLVEDADLASAEVLAKKSSIEDNHVFARKSIASLAQVKQFFTTPSRVVAEPPADVRDVWAEILAPHGLHEVLDESLARQNVVDRYVSEGAIAKSKGRSPNRMPAPKFPRVQHLELLKFRPYPQKRDFDFGAVNLIQGVNAAGKTSLLEAIELLVCGQTKRNRDRVEEFTFKTVTNGEEDTVTRHDDAIYRDRDCSWFGRKYLQGNELAQSFGRFNFFDSDAAAKFAEEMDVKKTDAFERAMKGIVFGPDAQALEERVESIQERFATEGRALSARRLEDAAALEAQKKRLESLKKIDPSSISLELIYSRLKATGFGDHIVSLAGADIAREVLNLKDRLQLICRSFKGPGARTPRALTDRSQLLSRIQDKVRELEQRIATLTLQQGRLAAVVDQANRQRNVARRLSEYSAASAWVLVDDGELRTLTSRLKLLRDIQRDYVPPNTPESDATQRLRAVYNRYQTALSSYRLEDEKARHRVAALTATEKRSEVLLQQVRTHAKELLNVKPDLAECPVCGVHHTVPRLSELVTRSQNLPPQVNAEIASLMQTLLRLGTESALLQSRIDSLHRLEVAATKLGLDLEAIDIRQAHARVVATLDSASKLETAIRTHELTIAGLVANGFSQKEGLDLLHAAGGSTSDLGSLPSAIARLEAAATKTLSETEPAWKAVQTSIAESNKELTAVFAELGWQGEQATPGNLALELENNSQSLKELAAVRAAIPALTDSADLLQLQAIVDELNSLIAERLRVERVVLEVFECGQAILKLERSLTELKTKIERTQTADAVLRKLISEAGLKIRLDDFLKNNGGAVKEMFLRIHSPREFTNVVFTTNNIRLVRATGEEAGPTELSTGQRAALALSVFLAMNSLLASGPDLILLDDPIVYVDDLNLLSFLDLLRDLAIENRRQIFFATANSRVGELFQRKFEFLESQFYVCPLKRVEGQHPAGHTVH